MNKNEQNEQNGQSGIWKNAQLNKYKLNKLEK